MKKFFVFLISLVLLFPQNIAVAQLQSESLVIIDTALDSDQPDFAANIEYEVCILDWSSCPNGQKFMEGKGSAYLSPKYISDNGFNHGSQMVSAALRTNPNLQIIFIRIVGNSETGSRLNVTPLAVAKALKWVYDNKEKFNIAAVSMSQGHHNLTTRTIYCPSENMVETMIDQLLDKGVPFFVAAGNSRDYERLDWPACYPSTVSIGALEKNGQIASYGNLDPKLIDYFEIGDTQVTDWDGKEKSAVGTSISTQIAAAKWLKLKSFYPELTNNELFEKLNNSAIMVKSSKIQNGRAFPSMIQSPEDELTIQSNLDELSQIRDEINRLFDLVKQLIYLIRK